VECYWLQSWQIWWTSWSWRTAWAWWSLRHAAEAAPYQPEDVAGCRTVVLEILGDNLEHNLMEPGVEPQQEEFCTPCFCSMFLTGTCSEEELEAWM